MTNLLDACSHRQLYRMLEQCIAQVNEVFSKHNVFVGVDDRGRYSCHKVNLVFVYFDAKYCVVSDGLVVLPTRFHFHAIILHAEIPARHA